MSKINFKEMATRLAGNSVGAVGGRVLSKKVLGNLSPTVKGLAMIALGSFGPAFAGKSGKGFIGDVGAGLTAAGAIELGEAFMPTLFEPSAPPVAGIGDEATWAEDNFENVAGFELENGGGVAGFELENGGGIAGPDATALDY